MLTIRPEQMESLDNQALERFLSRVSDHIRTKKFPLFNGRPEEELRDFVRLAVSRSLAYGIDREEDVVDFVELDCEFDSDFERQPSMAWSQEVLDDPRLDSEAKIDEIYERLGRSSFDFED